MESVCIFADSRGKNLAISNVETKKFSRDKINFIVREGGEIS